MMSLTLSFVTLSLGCHFFVEKTILCLWNTVVDAKRLIQGRYKIAVVSIRAADRPVQGGEGFGGWGAPPTLMICRRGWWGREAGGKIQNF